MWSSAAWNGHANPSSTLSKRRRKPSLRKEWFSRHVLLRIRACPRKFLPISPNHSQYPTFILFRYATHYSLYFPLCSCPIPFTLSPSSSFIFFIKLLSSQHLLIWYLPVTRLPCGPKKYLLLCKSGLCHLPHHWLPCSLPHFPFSISLLKVRPAPISPPDFSRAASSSPWWWQQHASLKRRFNSARLHDTICQKASYPQSWETQISHENVDRGLQFKEGEGKYFQLY